MVVVHPLRHLHLPMNAAKMMISYCHKSYRTAIVLLSPVIARMANMANYSLVGLMLKYIMN